MISGGTEDVTKATKRITVAYVYYFNKKNTKEWIIYFRTDAENTR